MSSVEVTHESPSLHIDSLLSQQGPVAVYKAHVGTQSHLFYFYGEPSKTTVQWLLEVLQIRSQVQHPNLSNVVSHGVLEEGGVGWSNQLEPGMSLREIWDNDPHNPLRSIRLVMQAVDAVVALHSHGGIHGDIRAQNFWVGWDSAEGETLTLLGEQLGLWSASERWDSTDMSLDVAECLSPEVAAGDIPNMKSDVYGLGVMLFRALHSHVPFPVDNAWEMAAMQATSELSRPELKPPVHEDLWSIIEDCLRKNPTNRLTVTQLQQRLSPFVQYKKPIFVDLELTDPQSIAEPSPPSKELEPVELGSKKDWTPVAPRPLQELSFVQARTLEDTTNADAKVHSSASSKQEKLPQAEEEKTAHSDVNSKTLKSSVSDKVDPIDGVDGVGGVDGEVTQEFTVKVDRVNRIDRVKRVDRVSDCIQNTDPDVTVKGTPSILEDNVVNPIQVLVGARPMPAATTGPLNREQTDSTNNISQLSWLEDSSERVIEAPVEFHVTATHGALSKTQSAKRSRNVTSHSKTQSNTGKVERARLIKSSVIPEQMQFVIFMTLSSVITVLLLKIVEKML